MKVSSSHAGATLALAAINLLLAAPCLAQEARATLSGTITDPSGSAIVGARVHITNLATGVALSAQSNEVGQYHLLFVNPGAYRLTVEMPGGKLTIQVAEDFTVTMLGPVTRVADGDLDEECLAWQAAAERA